MLEQPVSMPDARVAWDQRADRWLIQRADRSWRARRWNWGERRRLLAWAAPAGRLDADRFVAGLLDLLVSATPTADDRADEAGHLLARLPAVIGASSDAALVARHDEERDWLASVTLELLGVQPGTTAVSLAQAELAAARLLGWAPLELDRQPLPATDELLALLLDSAGVLPEEPAALDDSWTRILVDDD